MKRKYLMIFLMGMLCLVCTDNLFAQYYVSLKYDNKGNRTNLTVTNFMIEQRSYEEDVAEKEISNEKKDYGLLVYPNPNDGKFEIEIVNEACDFCMAALQIYDDKGVLIKNDWFVKTTNVDIGNNPAGIYLLRIIVGDNISNRIIVKL